ncbi:MAG: AarF/UbiB family protein, partial [Promethearchaeia archaeon]
MEKARGAAALACAVLVLSVVQPADGVLPMHGRACLATSSPCVVGMRLRGGASLAPAPPVPSEAAATAPAATFQDLLAALGGGGSAAAQQALKPSCREDTANFGVGMERSMRAMSVFNEVKADYEASLANISEPARRAQVLREVHARSAPKALKLARDNGGLYNKAAQFVASLQAGAGDRGIPKEYVDALSVLTDRAPGKPFAEMAPVLEEEFGKPVGEIFAWIEEQPLAAASLAQVHRAQLHNGTRVAVKIIYPLLRKEMASDFAVLRTFGGAIKPAGLDLTWLLADFQKALAKELDFESEAANAEQSARVLLHLPAVKIPRVFWQWTSKSVVTMELEESLLHLSDTASLSASRLD